MSDSLRSSPSGRPITPASLPIANSELAAMAANSVLGNPSSLSETPSDVPVSTNSLLGRGSGTLGEIPSAQNTAYARASGAFAAQGLGGSFFATSTLDPSRFSILNVTTGGVAPVFKGILTFAAGAAGARDVILFDASNPAPFGYRLLDVQLIVSTAVGGSSAQLRNVTGGGGSTRSSVLSTATTGMKRNDDTQTFTQTATQTLTLRCSDGGIAGTIIVTFLRNSLA